jgi:hypothetical protein
MVRVSTRAISIRRSLTFISGGPGHIRDIGSAPIQFIERVRPQRMECAWSGALREDTIPTDARAWRVSMPARYPI